MELDEKGADAAQFAFSSEKQMARLPPGFGASRATIFHTGKELVPEERMLGTGAGVPVLGLHLMDTIDSIDQGELFVHSSRVLGGLPPPLGPPAFVF